MDFWHQIFTNCWNNSFQQLTTVSVLFTDTHYIFFASDDVNVTCFLQVCRQQNNNATELARRSSCWKKSRLILSHQVCGLPVVLILTPLTRLYDMGIMQERVYNKGKIANVEELRQRISWTSGNVLISALSMAQWRSGENDCERVLLLKKDSLNMNCVWLVVKQCCCNCAFWLCGLIVWLLIKFAVTVFSVLWLFQSHAAVVKRYNAFCVKLTANSDTKQNNISKSTFPVRVSEYFRI